MDTKRRRRTVEPEDDWSLCFAMLQNRLRGLLQGASAVKAVMEATHALCAAPKTRNVEHRVLSDARDKDGMKRTSEETSAHACQVKVNYAAWTRHKRDDEAEFDIVNGLMLCDGALVMKLQWLVDRHQEYELTVFMAPLRELTMRLRPLMPALALDLPLEYVVLLSMAAFCMHSLPAGKSKYCLIDFVAEKTCLQQFVLRQSRSRFQFCSNLGHGAASRAATIDKPCRAALTSSSGADEQAIEPEVFALSDKQ